MGSICLINVDKLKESFERSTKKITNDLSLDERVGFSQIQEIDDGGKTKGDNTGKNH